MWHFVLPWRRGVERAVRRRAEEQVAAQVAAALAEAGLLLATGSPVSKKESAALEQLAQILRTKLYPVAYAQLVQQVAQGGYQPAQSGELPPPPGPGADAAAIADHTETVRLVANGLQKLGYLKTEAARWAQAIPTGCTVEEGLQYVLSNRGKMQ